VRVRARDIVRIEADGDLAQGLTTQVLGEDPTHDRLCVWVWCEPLELVSLGRLAWIGMRSDGFDRVPEGRASALVAALHLDLRTHAETDTCLNHLAFASAYASYDRHQDVVGAV
jgi:hypothetical protein